MNILEIMNIPYYKKGNMIHIKKENRGKFTRSAKEHNMEVLEFATHVLNNKDKYSPTLIKRANFAKNSKKFKHAKGGLVKKCQNGEIIGNQPISYKTWKTWQEMLPEHQKRLENLAMLQYADNKAKYGDNVPEETKYLYDMGLLPEVEITADRNLTKKEKMLADLQWSNYLAKHPMQIGSEEYNRLPEKARALVVKNSVTNAINKAALPTAAAIIAPTALTAGAASLVGSGALTAVADAAGTVGTKIAGTNLGQAASAFMNNPYIDMGLTGLGAYTVPSLYNSGVSNIKQGNYGRALGDFASIGLEGLGALGTINNIKNVYGPINRMMNGVYPKGIYTEPTTPKVTRISSSKMEAAPKYVINDTPGYLLKILMRGNPLEKQLSKEGTISINSIRALAQKGNNIEQEIINKILNSEEFTGLKVIDYNKFRKAVQNELVVYDRVPHEKYADYGIDRLGFESADPAGVSIAGYANITPETFVFESSKIPIGNAAHYNNNTLGHSRTYTTTTEPDVLHIMESLSDWGQKSKILDLTKFEKIAIENIDRAIQNGGDGFSTVEELLLKKLTILNKASQRWKNNSYLAQYLHDNYLQRQLQENMKLAAERGQTKMRYPTPETAVKIEGYSKINLYKNLEGKIVSGKEALEYTDPDIINDLRLDLADLAYSLHQLGILPSTNSLWIEMKNQLKTLESPKIKTNYIFLGLDYAPEHQTILKKYSDFPKLFKKLYKNQEVRLVTDPQGNTWYEVDVPKDYLNLEWQYKCGGKVKKKLIKKRK